MLDKTRLNFLIDALMFLCMSAIISLGFLMKFVLIPGKERWAKYGRNVELLLLGKDRHEWGTIHLSIGLVLLGLLALHIILHWKVIVALFRKLLPSRAARRILAPSFVCFSLLLLAIPPVTKPEIQELGRGHENGESGSLAAIEGSVAGCGACPESSQHDGAHAAGHRAEIRGSMTLAEVSERCDVPIHCLKTHLGIPRSASDEEKLGRLKRLYDFTMTDVERVISEYHREK